ncbi:hypothetical protein PoB_006865400 [Plakobranchus ocellatus]|uniref:Uncharacterized protein n=1 Tax=Plakobranchus ocellatus TaxID=259542 RepID=A0AAV4DDE1_9GAST|nr:hypothetical protein PoB_006865400 [Plakobranchus ocellatus]
MARRKLQSPTRVIKNPLTLFMLILTLFLFSTMLLFSPRMSHFTEVSKTYLIPPVVRTRNLHDTPTFKPIADFPRLRAEPQKLNSSSLKGANDTDRKSFYSKPRNVSKPSQSNSSSSSDSTLEIRHLSLSKYSNNPLPMYIIPNNNVKKINQQPVRS